MKYLFTIIIFSIATLLGSDRSDKWKTPDYLIKSEICLSDERVKEGLKEAVAIRYSSKESLEIKKISERLKNNDLKTFSLFFQDLFSGMVIYDSKPLELAVDDHCLLLHYLFVLNDEDFQDKGLGSYLLHVLETEVERSDSFNSIGIYLSEEESVLKNFLLSKGFSLREKDIPVFEKKQKGFFLWKKILSEEKVVAS
ncbi:MAG TPA: hypothetical protein P5048_03225 [Chlamydiales bacterium]|nr:hypothetical protein [Chlamydiales bacterium]